MMLAAYQKDFLRAALAVAALKFGDFTLKSGRQSPYFFNAGAFASGEALTVMGRAVVKSFWSAKKAAPAAEVVCLPVFAGWLG